MVVLRLGGFRWKFYEVLNDLSLGCVSFSGE